VPSASLSGRQGTCECFGGNADNPFASAGSHPTATVLRFSYLRYAWSECPEPPASASRVIWQSRARLPRRPGSKKGLRSRKKHRSQRIAKTNAALNLDAKRGGAIGQRADMHRGIGANTAARASPAVSGERILFRR
jgi:hypothetical protein